MYDAIVVGARCAGAPTAMLLARRGYKVLLVDKATFPSEIPHGHFIHRQGPRCLARWGLLDRVVASNCPAVTSFTHDYGDVPLVGRDLVVDGVALGYGPRRAVLDKILVDAAVEAGAELREGFVVEGFTSEGNRITGIRGRDRARATPMTVRAAITVGADGRNSRLAQAVRAPTYAATPTFACYYFSYWSDVPWGGIGVYARPNNAFFAHPTNDGLFAVFAAWPIGELHRVRADIRGNFMAALDQIPGLAEHVRAGRLEAGFYGASNLPNFFRKPYGPGWALVGDAGCHKDPFLALGISDAFRDVELLVDALDQGLSGRSPLDEAMAGYERRRNEAAMPDYQQNLHMAQFKPVPEDVSRLRTAVYGDREATNRFIMAYEGMIPRESFFNPENLQRLQARARIGAA
jgi:flavin-dependent dehydrogenase